MDFQNFLKGMDSRQMAEMMNKVMQFSKTEKGKEMIENLKNGGSVGGMSRDELLNALKKNPEAMKKISEIMSGQK